MPTQTAPHRRIRYPGAVDAGIAPTSGLLTNLVAYWKMDETLAGPRFDSVGTKHLRPVGTVSSSAGKIEGAMEVASGVNYLALGGTPVASGSARTLSMWVYPTSVAAQGNFSGVANVYNSAGPLFLLVVRRGGGSGPFAIYHAGSYRDGTTVASVNTWYHVVYTYSGTVADLWINGTREINLTLGDSGSVGHLFFGNVFTGYAGRVDEAGLWSRVLTSTEIAALYNGGKGATYPDF